MPPDPPITKVPIVIVTLGDYLEHGDAFSAWCPKCTRSAWLNIRALSECLGRDFRPDYNQHVRTTKEQGRLPVRCEHAAVASTVSRSTRRPPTVVR